jgi:hypothetical protein
MHLFCRRVLLFIAARCQFEEQVKVCDIVGSCFILFVFLEKPCMKSASYENALEESLVIIFFQSVIKI